MCGLFSAGNNHSFPRPGLNFFFIILLRLQFYVLLCRLPLLTLSFYLSSEPFSHFPASSIVS